MKTEPDAVRYSTHMDLVNFIHSIIRDRCSEYTLYDVCQKTSASSGSQLFCGSFYTHVYRNHWLYRQYSEHGSNSLWLLVCNIYNTLV